MQLDRRFSSSEWNQCLPNGLSVGGTGFAQAIFRFVSASRFLCTKGPIPLFVESFAKFARCNCHQDLSGWADVINIGGSAVFLLASMVFFYFATVRQACRSVPLAPRINASVLFICPAKRGVVFIWFLSRLSPPFSVDGVSIMGVSVTVHDGASKKRTLS